MQTTSFALAAGASSAGEPIRLGFDSYSIRDFHWKDIQLIEYAASLKLDAIQLSSLDDYASLDPPHLARVKQRAASLGIAIDAGIGCKADGPGKREDDAGGLQSAPKSSGEALFKVPTNRITEIVNGQRAVTGDTALCLAHFFGTSAEFWLNLQSLYDLRLAGQKAGKSIRALPTLKDYEPARI